MRNRSNNRIILISANKIFISVFCAVLGAIITMIPNQMERYKQKQLVLANDSFYAGDYQTAYDIYSDLAERGVFAAQSNLGIMYENGYWVDKNEDLALDYYLDAYANGAGSKKAIGNYIVLSITLQRNREQLIAIFKQAFDNKDYALLACAASCMESKEITAEEVRTTSKYNQKLSHIDSFFPNFSNDKLELWERTIDTSTTPLTEYETDLSARSMMNKSSTLKESTYTYYSRYNRDYILFGALRKGIAGWNE